MSGGLKFPDFPLNYRPRATVFAWIASLHSLASPLELYGAIGSHRIRADFTSVAAGDVMLGDKMQKRMSLCAAAAAALVVTTAQAAIIVSDNFESYATSAALLAAWPGNAATLLDAANGNPGQSAAHLASSTAGSGAVNARTFAAVNPTDAQPLSLSVDIFDDGTSANKRITTGLRNGANNIVELGMFNAPSHYAFRLILFASGNPNWVAFDTLGQSGIANASAVRWNRFGAVIGDTQTAFTLDLGADGSIEATHIVAAAPGAVGINEIRFGGPSALTSAGGGANFDNILLQTVPEPGCLSLLALGALGLVRRRRA
jgi:MYXO-CTERM domain-containing protein